MKISNNILQQQMMQRHFGRKDIIKVGVIKNNKKPQITGSIEINDAQDSEDLRLVDAIAFDVNCTYEYQTVTQGWFNFENNGQLHFDGDTVLMRKIGKEWKLDVTSCVWGY